MVKLFESPTYDYRILADSYFINWLSKEIVQRSPIILTLMRINTTSTEHKKQHNLMLLEEYEKIMDVVKDNDYFNGAFKIVQRPPFLDNESNDISKNIRFGIYLANSSPYKAYLFTAPERVVEYKQNEHYKDKDIKTLIIKGGTDILPIINRFYSSFKNWREMKRTTL